MPWAQAELESIKRQIEYAKKQYVEGKRHVAMIRSVIEMDLDRSQRDRELQSLHRAVAAQAGRRTTIQNLQRRYGEIAMGFSYAMGDSVRYPRAYGGGEREVVERVPMERQDYEYLR